MRRTNTPPTTIAQALTGLHVANVSMQTVTVVAAGSGTIDVRTAGGAIVRGVPFAGGARKGQQVRVQFVDGRPVGLAAGSGSVSGGASRVVAVAGASGLPDQHASTHENGGTDEINVAGLSGLLADGQTPLAHSSSHHSGGSDALSLGSLAGTLTDTQHGARSGGTLHAAATTGAAGFMAAADKSKLDGLPSSAVPTTRQVIAGSGLTGGGDLSADRTLNVGAGDGISVAADAVAVDATVVRTTRQVATGDGLSGGGTLAADRTLAVDTSVVRTTRTLTAGAGLSGGGTLAADRTFAVGGGTGITVNADDVAVNQGYGFTWTAQHAFNPASVVPPFTLGANAQGQKVVGLNADLLDGFNSDANASNSTVVVRDGSGNIAAHNATLRHVMPEATDTYDLGSSTVLWRKGWLSELDAIVFAENTIQIIGGWFMIPKRSGTLPFGASAGTSPIDFGQTMYADEFVLMRMAGQVEYIKVLSSAGGTSYNVTRDLDGTGSNNWIAGTPFVVLGVSGDGRIELNASDTPRISLVRQGATYNAQTELVRIGDLNAWGPYGGETWGMAVGEYGAGKTSLTAEATNGIRIFNGSTVIGQWAADGSITVGEVGSSKDNIYIAAGALSIRNNTTERIGLTAAGVLSIKDSGGNAVFTFDAAAGAEFTLPLSIGANGGIWQGSAGSFASPDTGLKIYQSSSKGIWEAWSGGTKQVYLDPADMTLKAGGGGVAIGANGISLAAHAGSGQYIHWDAAGGHLACFILTAYVSPSAATQLVTIGDNPGVASLYLGVQTSTVAGLQLYASHASYGTYAHLNMRLVLSATGPSGSSGSPGDIEMDGKITMGGDVELNRSAADILNTPDSLVVGGDFQAGGHLTLSGTTKRIKGDFSNATQAFRTLFQTLTTDGNTNVGAVPNGASDVAAFTAYSTDDATDAAFILMGIDATPATKTVLRSAKLGSGTLLPLGIEVGAGNEWMRIATDGKIGIGRTAPQGRLHGYDTIGGFLYWEYDGVDGTVRTVIPDGAGDVLYSARVMYVIRGSDGTIVNNNVGVSNGGDAAITVGASTFNIRVNANGSMDVRRSAGSLTAKIALWVVWL